MKPVIMIVDDEPAQLTTMHGDLDRRYGGDYRVVAHAAPRTALEELEAVRAGGVQVALLIADQWMPVMNGVEFLQAAHALHPSAQRALLVNWGDKRAMPAILQSCAFNQIENYLLKPYYPPEVHLYPLIGEFLSEWTREHGPRMELVRVIQSDPSLRGYEVIEFLERYGVPHGVYPADSAEGRRLLRQTGLDGSRLPVIVMRHGRVLVEPSNAELMDELGISTLDEERTCDLAIVGAGPAGLAAAVYGASEGLRTLVIEREAVGGQAGSSSLLRNYLGFPRGISGAELAQRAYQQAWLFGAKYALGREVCGLRAAGPDRIIALSDGSVITARAVLIATGAAYRRLGVPNLERFTGAGVFYAAGGEVALMQDRDVIVAGGGNSAGQAVVHLAKHARRVVQVVRGESLIDTMSDYLIRQIRRLPNVEVRFQTEVVDGEGAHRLERVAVKDHATGRVETLEVQALFVLIGVVPHTDWLTGAVERDEQGFIITGADLKSPALFQGLKRPPMRLETSLPGVFAAGDVRLGSVKRVASAAGEGAIAVKLLDDYFVAPVSL
ncbi:MAG TPA: FAD-dependent oxidoreductase [Nitrospiria bacterium]|nr:FAD-dependent oxidoreductase [Nitrospiria bacterium]